MTMFLDSPEAGQLARQKSVRGAVVRAALQKAATADAEQKVLLEAALRELLQRFARQTGESA